MTEAFDLTALRRRLASNDLRAAAEALIACADEMSGSPEGAPKPCEIIEVYQGCSLDETALMLQLHAGRIENLEPEQTAETLAQPGVTPTFAFHRRTALSRARGEQ